MGFTKQQNKYLRKHNIMRKGPLGPVARKQVNKIATRAIHRANQDKKAIITKTSAALDFNQTFTQLTLIATGTTNATRDTGSGYNIYCKYINIRGSLIIGTNSSNVIRMIVFRWKPTITVDVPTTGDLLDNDATVGGVYNDLALQNKQKLVILHDRLFELDTVNKPRVTFSRRIRVNHRIGYDNSDAVGNTGTNQIYVMFQSNSNTVTLPSYEYTASVYFEEN